MRIIGEGTIFAGTPGTRTASTCFPSVVKVGSRLLASWRVGSNKDSADGTIFLSHSDDAGKTWSPPHEPWSAELAGFGHGELRFAPLAGVNGEILAAVMRVDRSHSDRPLFNPDTEGLLPTRTLLYRSRDGGESWGGVQDLGEGPCRCPSPLTGPLLDLGGGTLAIQFEVNKSYDDPAPWRHAAAMRLSRDGGRSWDEYREVATDPTGRRMFWDQHHARNSAGGHLAAFWVYDREKNQDATIHLARPHAGGMKWGEPWDTGLVGQVAHPILFDDGRVLLAYVDRFGDRGIFGKLSYDGGASFEPQRLPIYLHAGPTRSQDAACSQYLGDMNLWTFGRVDGIAEQDGRALLIYYAGTSQRTQIQWSRVEL